ncbi:hypothetical protein GCM10027037_13020 [Mucilaginibacter koreensis]
MFNLKKACRVTAVCLLLASVIACSNKAHQSKSFHQYLSSQLHPSTQSIDLSKFDEFAWDRFYVMPPYTTQKNLDSTLAKHADRVLETDIEYADNQCLLVFFYKEELVSLIPVKRTLDFAGTAKYSKQKKLVSYSRTQSILHVSKGSCEDCYIIKP